jgi:hypothetical protein
MESKNLRLVTTSRRFKSGCTGATRAEAAVRRRGFGVVRLACSAFVVEVAMARHLPVARALEITRHAPDGLLEHFTDFARWPGARRAGPGRDAARLRQSASGGHGPGPNTPVPARPASQALGYCLMSQPHTGE